jgi:peptidoglycan/LPS O-acetylase OafA/YrhL
MSLDEQKYFPELDGLRAIAAWTVVFYHLGKPIVPGSYGVVLFFVLSGFLITLLLLRESKTGAVSLRAFYMRRTLRIMPAFYGFLFFAVAWKSYRGSTIDFGHLASAATYTVNYYHAIWGDPNSGFSHAWSLAIEEQFYLIWPITLVWLVARKVQLTSLWIAILAVWAIRLFLKFATNLPQEYFYSSLEMRADALLVGCLLAICWMDSGTVHYLTRVARFAPVLGLTAVVGVAGLSKGEAAWGVTFRDTATATLLPLLCALAIYASIAASGSFVSRALSSPPMRWLGKLSYSTYLYQQLVPGWGAKILPAAPPAIQLSIELIVVLVLALASYFIIEQPFLRIKVSLEARRFRAAVQA